MRCAPRPTSQQRNGGGISIELTSHAVVARAGRRQEERRTQARTVECTHSFSIRKAPTDRRVLHISHTHTRRHRCCFFGAPGVAAPRVTLHTLPPSQHSFCDSFPFKRPRRRHACLCIFVCVLCMLSACIVFVCEEVSADLRFQCPILRHVSTLEVLCQAVAQPILRCRNFQATTLHSETRQSNFSNKIHLVNVKVILSKKFHPVGFVDMMQVKPTVLATFVQHLFRRLACNGTTNLTFFHHHSASNI